VTRKILNNVYPYKFILNIANFKYAVHHRLMLMMFICSWASFYTCVLYREERLPKGQCFYADGKYGCRL